MSYKLPGRIRKQVRIRKKAITKSLIGLFIIFFLQALTNSKIGQYINNAQLQLFFLYRQEVDPPKDIIIAAIDDQSFSEENISGLQAWPRDLAAEVLENLYLAGAKIAVLDLLIDPTTTVPIADQKYINALKQIPSSIAMFEFLTRNRDETGRIKFKNNIKKPRQEFIDAAKFLVPMMVKVDTDGYVRRFYHNARYIKQGRDPIPQAEVTEFYLNKKLTELPERNEYINYYGPSGSFPTVSINKFLTKNITQKLKDAVKNKIIVIGTFRQSQVESTSEDQFSTNYGKIFGAEIHATIMANLIENNWIRKFDLAIEFFITCVICILSASLSVSLGSLAGSLAAITSAILLTISSYILFLNNYFLPCFTYCFLIAPILIIGIVSFHYFTTLRAFKNVEEALGVSLRPKK